MKDVKGLLLLSSRKQELRGLMESEDEVPKEKDGQGHTAKHYDSVTPSHVTVNGTASNSRLDVWTSRRFGIAAPFSLAGGAVGNARGNGDTNGLPHGKKRDKEAAVMR